VTTLPTPPRNLLPEEPIGIWARLADVGCVVLLLALAIYGALLFDLFQ